MPPSMCTPKHSFNVDGRLFKEIHWDAPYARLTRVTRELAAGWNATGDEERGLSALEWGLPG